MPDFDALFENYLQKWLEENKGKYTADELEDMLPQLYEEYVTTPCEEADGLAPEQYYARIDDANELIDIFVKANEGDGNACSLLLDRIIEVDACVPILKELVVKPNDAKIVIGAMNLLDEMGGDHPLSNYASWLVNPDVDEGVAEKSAEILKEHAESVKEQLLSSLDKATQAQKLIIADVLVDASKDERTYALLKELFQAGENIPYCAGLIAKYGDERAAEFLFPALDECNYMEFIEIRNAIEQMGGVVDDSYRDFSADPYYKAIKNLK